MALEATEETLEHLDEGDDSLGTAESRPHLGSVQFLPLLSVKVVPRPCFSLRY